MKDKIIEEIELIGANKWVCINPNSKDKIKSLMKMYATAYYEGNALITDLEFEYLVDVLKIYDANDSYLTTPGWGYTIENGIEHIYGKVGSLPYYFTYQEIEERLKDFSDLIITPKFDGINFVAYYKDGKFDKCATRGNGLVGKNITWAYDNNLTLSDNLKNKTFAINGEVIYFDKINKNISFRDKVATYLNKQNKIDEKIKFMPFGLINSGINYYEQILEINKIITPKINYKLFKKLPTSKELRTLFEEYGKIYQIDGLVITDTEKQIQLAYKFKE